MAIYLKNIKKPKSVRQLLGFLFSSYNGTTTVRNVITYSDPECKEVQCLANKYRSFDDILEICKTYFPNVGVKRVAKDLFNLRIKVKENEGNVYLNPSLVVCNDINKGTIFFYTSAFNPYANYHTDGPLGGNISQRRSGQYSWLELLQKVGVKDGSLKEFKEYYSKNYYTKTIRMKSRK